MNETVVRMLPLMKDQKEFRMIHATGSYYYRDVTKKLQEAGVDTGDCNADVREYIYDTARVLCAADLVLCRAGASTLSELSSIGKPALIVPSPNVTNHHQEKNARLVERAGGARVLLEGEFDEESFLAEIRKLISEPETLSDMSRAMKDLAVPDALDQIVDTVLEYARKGNTKK